MKLFRREDTTTENQVSQSRIDAIVAAARAQDPVPDKRPLFREVSCAPLVPSSQLIDRRLEEELAFVRRSLDAMGERLADDPILLTRYQTLLQSFDLLGQTLGHLATVVGAADRAEAVERIGMVELRARLQRTEAGSAQSGPTLVRGYSNPFSNH